MALGTERGPEVARSKGRVEYFEPSNTVGLDTRIWQQRGSANKILGAVFSMAGEIVKIDGLRRLVDWDSVESDRIGVITRQGALRVPLGAQILSFDGVQPESYSSGEEWTITDNPFSEVNGRNKIFTLGTFTWGETVELMVAWGDENTVHIGVLESNTVRLLKTIEIQTMDVRPRFYPRFVDVGQFVLILVGGHAMMKWDGKVLTRVGIESPPEPITARFLRGTSDIFYENCSIDRNDAASVRLHYYQTFINKYGQESELSAPSNQIFMNDYFGLSIGEDDDDKTVGHTQGSLSNASGQSGAGHWHSTGGGTGRVYHEQGQAADVAGPTLNIGADDDVGDTVPFGDRSVMVFLDLGQAPDQEDIVERGLYRSINNQLPTALPRRLGPRARTHFDVRRPSESSADPAPAIGENLTPPFASWAFPFRGRTYYGGVPSDPSILYYSSLHRPEAVSVTSFLEVNSNDADRLTGWGVAQDYAIVFKRRSAYLLTHDKGEFPVLTPLQATFGAISDRAVASIDSKTYFMSDVGIHVFDGSRFDRISKVLDNMVRGLPEFSRDNAVMWADAKDERIYLAVSANPGSENNEVWVIQADTGAFSRIAGREVTDGIPYKGESIVALYNNGSGFPDLYLWGGGCQIDKAKHTGVYGGFWTETTTYTLSDPNSDDEILSESTTEDSSIGPPGVLYWPDTYPPQPVSWITDVAGIQKDIGGPLLGDYETEWLEVEDPNTDKRFYKIALYFVQTGKIPLNIEWCLDWDDRNPVGSTTIELEADDATTWSMLDDDGIPQMWDVDSDQKWDKRRVVCKMIDLGEAHGKCIRFRFHTGEVEDYNSTEIATYTTPEIMGGALLLVDESGEEVESELGVSLSGTSFAPVPGVDGLPIDKRNKPRCEPWRLVGWHLFLEDHGVRSRGTDGIT